MNISTFIFDLDGTLTDPLLGMADSINNALRVNGFSSCSAEEIAQYVGPPLEGTMSQLTGSTDDTVISRLVSSYRECYLDTGYAQNTVYGGIRNMLERLRDHSIPMGVCTSKPTKTASKILRLFELNEFFDFVSGGDSGVRKSEQLETLLEAGRIDRAALMIGDRAVDISAAKSNQLNSAGVAWGYGSTEELSQAAADFHFDLPADVLQLAGCAA